jgi:PleD family two-component response regulator
VSRYGGEEFCILLEGIDEDEAIAISNRARLAFKGLCGQVIALRAGAW